MPRVNRVKKARKDQGSCGRCRTPLPAGSAYRWWKFRHGGKHKRCMAEKCRPRASELTGSEFLSAVYSAQETFSGSDYSTPDELADALRTMAEELREAAQIRIEAADAIEGGFGHETEQSYTLREEGEAIEYWADDIESAADDVGSIDLDQIEEDLKEEYGRSPDSAEIEALAMEEAESYASVAEDCPI